jgi:hypothetical protein
VRPGTIGAGLPLSGEGCSRLALQRHRLPMTRGPWLHRWSPSNPVSAGSDLAFLATMALWFLPDLPGGISAVPHTSSHIVRLEAGKIGGSAAI